jgi:hypothetical protein
MIVQFHIVVLMLPDKDKRFCFEAYKKVVLWKFDDDGLNAALQTNRSIYL